MMRSEIPPLPKLFHTIEDLRDRFQGNQLVLNLIARDEAFQKREEFVHEAGETLHLATQNRWKVPAAMVAGIAKKLALGFGAVKP